MDPALIRLVGEAASVEGEALQQRDFEPQRRRFLAHARRQQLRRRALLWLAPVAAAAVVVLALVLEPLRSSAALSFTVQGRPGASGAWLTAQRLQPLPLMFSDGSSVILTGEARGRVSELQDEGASVVLERGSLKAAVVHGHKTNWRFDAGPFHVRVLGTKFAMEWDPSRERFMLELIEGSVVVSGPKLEARCVVQAGHRLQIELMDGTASGPCIPLQPEAEAIAAPEPTVQAVAFPSASSVPPPPSWQALAAQGKYEAAWTVVSATGFERLKQQAPARDLMVLADLARYARKSNEATQVLLELRRRFAGSPEAGRAAFLLGRIAADQQGAPLRGGEWFATYLVEHPDGAFASEAFGRLLECQERAGQTEAARKTAVEYLRRYPKGPYGALAQHALATAEPSAPAGGAERR